MLHPIEIHRHSGRYKERAGSERAEFLWRTNETLHNIIHQVDSKIAILTLPWVFLSERIFEGLRGLHGHIPDWGYGILIVTGALATVGVPPFWVFRHPAKSQ